MGTLYFGQGYFGQWGAEEVAAVETMTLAMAHSLGSASINRSTGTASIGGSTGIVSIDPDL